MVDERRWRTYASVQLLKLHEHLTDVAAAVAAGVFLLLLSHYQHELATVLAFGLLVGFMAQARSRTKDREAVQELLRRMDDEARLD